MDWGYTQDLRQLLHSGPLASPDPDEIVSLPSRETLRITMRYNLCRLRRSGDWRTFAVAEKAATGEPGTPGLGHPAQSSRRRAKTTGGRGPDFARAGSGDLRQAQTKAGWGLVLGPLLWL